MKMPTKCPKCKGPLLSDNFKTKTGSDYWTKHCNNYLDHSFSCQSMNGSPDELLKCIIKISSNFTATWFFFPNALFMERKSNNVTDIIDLPFFYPNLDSYQEVINKIKTYMLFI